MEVDYEQINEYLKSRENKERPKTRFETYQDDLLKYLVSKLEGSNIPASTLMEIAQFAMVQTHIVVQDEIIRANKEWNRQMRRDAKKVKE